VLGALIAGQLWQFGDGKVAFIVGGFFALLGSVIAWYWLPPSRQVRRAGKAAAEAHT